MATWDLGGFADFLITEKNYSANAYQWTYGVSQTLWTQSIKWYASSHTREKSKCSPQCTSSTTPGAIFVPHPHRIHYSKLQLTKCLVNHVDNFLMYVQIGNNECTNMQLQFEDSRNPTVFITSSQVGGVGHCLTAGNHTVISQKFWVLNGQLQAIAQLIGFGQITVPDTWLLNMGPGGGDIHGSDHHWPSSVAELWAQPSVSNGSGFGPETPFCSGSKPFKNRTCCFLAVQNRPRTRQPVGYAGFGSIRQVQSLVLHFGLFYLSSHWDILLIIV